MGVEPELFRWSVGQGALAVVLLVVFWKYRSDLKTLIDQRGQELVVLTSLVGETKSALMANGSGLQSLRDETRQLAAEIRRLAIVTEERLQRREHLASKAAPPP